MSACLWSIFSFAIDQYLYVWLFLCTEYFMMIWQWVLITELLYHFCIDYFGLENGEEKGRREGGGRKGSHKFD